MTGTIVRIGWINLRRDRTALLLTFLLPIAFFSIFAMIFGGSSGGGTGRVEIAICDLDGSDGSRRLAAALAADPGLRATTETGDPPAPLTRESARMLVANGDLPVAVVIPKGFGDSMGQFAFGGGGSGAPESARVELLADSSDPVAPQLVFGLLQRAGMNAAPDLLARSGLSLFEKYAGGFTPQQKEAVDRILPELRGQAAAPNGGAAAGNGKTADAGTSSGIVPATIVDVLGESKKSGIIAFYAAGTGVMFLLFSMSAMSGTLLDDQESGALERLLTTPLGMTRLLLGKWIFMVAVGSAQLLVMFVFGAVVFGLELKQHLSGFAIMTLATAAAAAGLGLVLATVSRTRAQQSGMATIVILMMSAVGGSMFPRFLMSGTMQKIGLFTFNAWALDGFQKIFWYEQPLSAIVPQVCVLVVLAAAFLAVARRFARRWEAV